MECLPIGDQVPMIFPLPWIWAGSWQSCSHGAGRRGLILPIVWGVFLNHFKPTCLLPQNWDDDPTWAAWGLWATRQLWKRRTMSRTAAKKVIAQEAFEASMKGIVCDTHPAVRDEAPQAYKDLGQASWQRRWKSWNMYPEDPWNHKQGTAARSGLGLFLQVQRFICKVLWELWEPFVTRHGDDCIAIAIGRHSSRSQHSKICSSQSLYGRCVEWNL